jgi:hypothetical protein
VSALVDPRGCLTPAGMAAVQRAPVGGTPAELAQHLATCARCQARLLAAAAGHPGRPDAADARAAAGSSSARRLLRTVAFVVAALVLAMAALALVALLRPGG